MSSLSVGIVGLPNVGKSTLFNALLQKQAALAANYPFATIEPNVGIVPVPDAKLPKLQTIVNAAQIIPATVEFVDIAGLVAGAAEGAGLGNKFLSHIREVSVIAHVVRHFSDGDIIREGSKDPISDFQTILYELQLADLQTLSKQRAPKGNQDKELLEKWTLIERWSELLNDGALLHQHIQTDLEKKLAKELSLLTAKPYLIVTNVGEEEIDHKDTIRTTIAQQLQVAEHQVVVVCAKLEAELAALSEAEKEEYMGAVGLQEFGLEQLIRQAYETLGLQSYYTAGEKEARAWTIPQGTTAPQAAGVIHTDFEKHFIKANVVDFADFVAAGGWKGAKEKGKMRQEGRDYIMQPDDVVEFMIGK